MNDKYDWALSKIRTHFTGIGDFVDFVFPPFISLHQESRKQVKLQKKEPLVESQLFIMELSRELNKICQVGLLLFFRIYCIYGCKTSLKIEIDVFTHRLKCSSDPSLYHRGQTSSPTSGPVKTSGRPVCAETLSWNGPRSYTTGSR